VIAARLIHDGIWRGPGVLSPEQLDPDPFLERLSKEGMPWKVRDDSAQLPRVPRLSRPETAAA
jgi:saccharopine dehydrogenase-like NADP-dependent oxidoreductase